MTLRTCTAAIAAGALSFSVGVVRAAAQETADAVADAPIRLGAVGLAPTLEFSSGVDTNVFNVAQNPIGDFMWTLSPRTTAAARLGPAQLGGDTSLNFNYFRRSTTERSLDFDGSMKVTVPLNRLRPYMSSSYLRTRQRPSLEVDARSLHRQRSLSVGAALRLSGKTDLDVARTSTEVAFDGGAVYYDTFLSTVFNRTTRTLSLSVRHALTPLTTVVMAVDKVDERFKHSPDRNARSLRVAPGVEFASSALVSGYASLGYRSFEASSSSMPSFRGAVASAALSYTWAGSTRLGFQATRDVEYSFDATAPYYVLAGLGGSVSQRVTDAIGITGRSMRYRFSPRVVAAAANRSETADTLHMNGGSVLYKIGRDLRLTVDIDHYRRVSPVFLRQSSGLRALSSVAYEH